MPQKKRPRLTETGSKVLRRNIHENQSLPHEADYDDRSRFGRQEVLMRISETKEAIAVLNGETGETRRSLTTMAIHRHRQG